MRHSTIWIILCVLPLYSVAIEVHAESSTAVDSEKQEFSKKTAESEDVQLREWFSKYDRIRRDSEMTVGERLQAMFLLAKTTEKRDAVLAGRMLKKYKISLAALKELEKIPETTELQDGYIEYFDKAIPLFSTYLDEQKEEPIQNLSSAKKSLEELDKANKKLDEKLRKKFNIPRHQHR